MIHTTSNRSPSTLSPEERNRRKRERIIIVVVIALVGLITFLGSRIIRFGADVSVSNSMLMFILMNINLLLIILLLFLVFRNLVKLIYDRRRKVMGARLRTKLVAAFITLTLMPTIILFFFSIGFITSSIEFWFSAPIEKALLNSLQVGRRFYSHAEDNNRFFLERIGYQIKTKKLLNAENTKKLSHYIQVVQRAFNINGVEIYATNSKRLAMAVNPELEDDRLPPVSADNLQKEMTSGGVRTISETIPAGELIRTIGTIPFAVKPLEADAFIVLTVLTPSDLSKKMASISEGYEGYQQIKLLKSPIRTSYYLTLSIVALLVVFCAIWLGFYLAKTISIPIMELAEGTRRVAEGDLEFSIAPVGDVEIGSLVSSFNKMTRDLRIGREQLELSARKLREQNMEIEERRQYMEVVLRNVSAGVITLDAAGHVTTMNKSAERMLARESADVLHQSYKALVQEPYLDLAREIMDKLDAGEDALELPLRATIEGKPRSFLVSVNALKDEEGHHMGSVMVFDDLTELEKAERMAAWREVARRIAHEVKNPLTPIALSAQRLSRKYSSRLDEQVFDECTKMIIDHVELIRNLVNEFSFFARFPSANPKPRELQPIIEETVVLYREGHQNVRFDVSVPETPLRLNLDRQQIKQALINLVENAIASIRGIGVISITVTGDPILKTVRIEIADDGPGISDDHKTRLFEPNFSTKKRGMGLGLTIVNTIVVGHNGRVSVQDNQPRGAKFVIELPM
ncbi:MAG: PAS domain-containing protein [Desulfobacterales bacterium]|nr:PAS domain-containing protein [Desulfobacterales bacterium]